MSIVTDEIVKAAWASFDGKFFEDRLSVESMTRMRRTIEAVAPMLAKPTAEGEAVGEVFGPKALSNMVALDRPLPPGSKLYTHPAEPPKCPHSVASREGTNYCDLAERRAVPEGWALVPERMTLTRQAVAALAFLLGADEDSKEVDDRWSDGLLWVGKTEGDKGQTYYGLNVANAELLEEGSLPLVEFAEPSSAERADVPGWQPIETAPKAEG